MATLPTTPSLGAVQTLNEVTLFNEVAASDSMLAHPRFQEITAGLVALTHDFEGLKVFYAEHRGTLCIAGCHTLHPDRVAYPLDHAGLARAIRSQSPRFCMLSAEVQKEFRQAMRGEPADGNDVHFGGTRFLAEGSHGSISAFVFEPSGSFGAFMDSADALEQLARFHANICLAQNLIRPIRAAAGTERLAQRVRELLAAAA